MTEHIIEPQVGMRFELHGAAFEVVFVQRGMVRYAANAGGRQYRIPIAEFSKLASQGTIQVKQFPGPRVLTAESIAATARKHRYVEAVLRQLPHPTSPKPLAKVIQQVATEIGDPFPPSRRTVIYWLRTYEISGERGLVHKVHPGNRVLRFDPQLELLISEAICAVHLKPEHSNALDVRSYVIGRLAELGLCTASRSTVLLPSLRTIQRRLKQLDPVVVARAKGGEIAANRIARAAGRTIRAGSILCIVEMDTHYLDILVIDLDTGEVLGRPYLTCLLDVCTRAVVGIYISMYPPSATTALAALKDMLSRPQRGLPGGIAIMIVPDNGVEFKNTSFARVCEVLAITISPAQIRDPNGKAHIERFFYSLTCGVVQKIPGTTFSNPQMRGDYDSEKRACLTITQLSQLIDQWINEVYHQTIHLGTGRAPILHWEEIAKVVPPISLTSEEADAIARRPVKRTIQHGRVQIDNIEYFSHALATLQAQGADRVTVLVDDLNLHTVLVQHPSEKDTLIQADSTDPEYTAGLTCHMHEEAMRIRKEWSQADLKKLGQNANAMARAQLLAKIQGESQIGKKLLRKLTNGLGSKTNASQQQAKMVETKPPGAARDPSPMPAMSMSDALSSERAHPVSGDEDVTPYSSFELDW